MNTKQHNRKRRATILLLVVSILALLFVIVTGFLSVARNTRQLVVEAERGATLETILASTKVRILTELGEQIVGEPSSATVSAGYEMVPGYRGNGRLLSPILPAWHEGFDSEETLRTDFPSGGAMDDADLLTRMIWPALPDIEGGIDVRPRPASIVDLIPENPDDDDDRLETQVLNNDLERYARLPRFDADGDGIPDNDLLRVASLTEQANQLAGAPVRIRNVLRNEFPQSASGRRPESFMRLGDPMQDTPEQTRVREAWRTYNENARYEISFRAVPHGGMLALDAAPVYLPNGSRIAPWNRDFVTSTFDNLRTFGVITRAVPPTSDSFAVYPESASTPDQVNHDDIFAEISKASSLIEPLLRRRGGLLPSFLGREVGVREYDASDEPIPPILSFLQGTLRRSVDEFPDNLERSGFPQMFVADYRDRRRAYKREPFQRFNIGEMVSPAELVPPREQNERFAFATAAGLPVTTVVDDLPVAGVAGETWRLNFARRALLTAISNSDDRARKLDVRAPLVPKRGPHPANPNPREAQNAPNNFFEIGTQPGDAKFWLGQIFSRTQEFQTQALTVGTFTSPQGAPQTQFDIVRTQGIYQPYFQWPNPPTLYAHGDRIVEALANRYYDMLGGHSDAVDDTDPTRNGWGDAKDIPLNTTPQTTEQRQAVSRRQQAIMLAVNTIAFAAPRGTGPRVFPVGTDPRFSYGGDGYLDAVSYVDWRPGATPGSVVLEEYVGYGPQLVLTEGIAFGEGPDENPDGTRPSRLAKIAVALELYNPNDPHRNAATDPDVHSLWLQDFAISLNGTNPNDLAHRAPTENGSTDWRVLSSPSITSSSGLVPERLDGRSFIAYNLQFEGNTRGDTTDYFTSTRHSGGVPTTPIYTIRGLRAIPLKRSVIAGQLSDNVGAGQEWTESRTAINLLSNPSGEEPSFFVVDLWRKGVRRNAQNSANQPPGTGIVWYHVDRLLLHVPDNADSQMIDRSWWTSTARDTTESRHFGQPPNEETRALAMPDRSSRR